MWSSHVRIVVAGFSRRNGNAVLTDCCGAEFQLTVVENSIEEEIVNTTLQPGWVGIDALNIIISSRIILKGVDG